MAGGRPVQSHTFGRRTEICEKRAREYISGVGVAFLPIRLSNICHCPTAAIVPWWLIYTGVGCNATELQHVCDQGEKNRFIVNLLITFVMFSICVFCTFNWSQRVLTLGIQLWRVFTGAESFCCLFPHTLRSIWPACVLCCIWSSYWRVETW